MRGVVVSVNLSETKGVAKNPVSEIELRPDWGVVGDAHAGPGDRQVSLLATETVDRWKDTLARKREKESSASPGPMPNIGPGAFAENLTTRGIDLPRLRIGTPLRIGAEVRAAVSKIGKECHAGCAIFQQTGACPMPKEGIFVGILKGGVVRSGDEIIIDANRDSDDQ